jgi:hypothetical protein
MRTTDAVGNHGRAAGDARAISPRLADHRRGLAGDRRFVDERDTLDDFAVTRNDLVLVDDDFVAGPQITRGDLLHRTVCAASKGGRGDSRSAQRLRLSLPSLLGNRCGEIGEQHGQEQPNVERDKIADRNHARRRAERRLDHIQQSQDGADLDDEHDRVLPLNVGAQHDDRLLQRGQYDLRREQVATPGQIDRRAGNADGVHGSIS